MQNFPMRFIWLVGSLDWNMKSWGKDLWRRHRVPQIAVGKSLQNSRPMKDKEQDCHCKENRCPGIKMEGRGSKG